MNKPLYYLPTNTSPLSDYAVNNLSKGHAACTHKNRFHSQALYKYWHSAISLAYNTLFIYCLKLMNWNPLYSLTWKNKKQEYFPINFHEASISNWDGKWPTFFQKAWACQTFDSLTLHSLFVKKLFVLCKTFTHFSSFLQHSCRS